MPVPKSVIKIKKGNIEYISNVDAVQFTMQELIRGAMRDVGKFLKAKYRETFYRYTHRKTGLAGNALQYWVRKKETDLQIGLWKTKNPAKGFWGGFYEIGSTEHNIPKLGIMEKTVQENLDTIIDIESKYLSELNKDRPKINIQERDYEDD